uniref:Uncharacterized protein n=1 Tax=Zooxanthella nutricula TaxID=1333877 RepID=A0A7S2MJZ1_9DINO|mmetsp:Transcript_102410/g.313162  ORF Transcript_102410/g.313162 Transcript_102410/m.313162 type:complete len:184 (+) Transcript_102410:115-666(+)
MRMWWPAPGTCCSRNRGWRSGSASANDSSAARQRAGAALVAVASASAAAQLAWEEAALGPLREAVRHAEAAVAASDTGGSLTAELAIVARRLRAPGLEGLRDLLDSISDEDVVARARDLLLEESRVEIRQRLCQRQLGRPAARGRRARRRGERLGGSAAGLGGGGPRAFAGSRAPCRGRRCGI